MGKAPAFQFYVRDWLSDPLLKMVCHQTKGIWIDLLCYLWESPDRGTLEGSNEQFIKMIGCTSDEWKLFYKEASVTHFADVTNSNGLVTVCNRRMYRDGKNRQNTRLRVQRYREKRQCNADGNTKVTPSSSSSPSSSNKEKYKRKVPLPKDYKLTHDHMAYAELKGITQGFEDIFEAFCIHHTKQGSKFIDWFAAWQTWIRKRIEFNKGSPIQPGIEYDGTAVEEMNQELEKITPELRAKNKAMIAELAKGATKKI